jgi:hypothetical protein
MAVFIAHTFVVTPSLPLIYFTLCPYAYMEARPCTLANCYYG